MSRLITPDECTWFLDEDDIPLFICAEEDHANETCAKCQAFDGTTQALIENVMEGLMMMCVKDDGQLAFMMTPEGNARAEQLIATDPEAKDLVDQFEIAKKVNEAFPDESK